MGFDSMSPMDALNYFDSPIETVFSLVLNTPKKVALYNPQRIAIIFSCSIGVTPMGLSTRSGGTSQTGIVLTTQTPIFELYQYCAGPLTASEWWATPSANGSLTVFEVTLNSWPTSFASPRRPKMMRPVIQPRG